MSATPGHRVDGRRRFQGLDRGPFVSSRHDLSRLVLRRPNGPVLPFR